MEASGAEAPAGSARIAGLDAWRAGLMLGGLLVHGAVWQERHWLFDVVESVSHSFRMGTFFAISGFLAACSLRRRAPDEWLRRRLVSLGVPFLFGMVTIAPLMWRLAQLRGGVAASTTLPFDWHHLWFLPGLLLYSILAARWADPATRWFARRVRAAPSFVTVMLGTALLSAALLALAGEPIVALAPSVWLDMLGKARLIAGFLPMFALGYLAANHPPIRQALVRGWVLPAATLAIVAAANLFWFVVVEKRPPGGSDDAIGQILPMIAFTVSPPAVFALVLQTATRMERGSPTLEMLCDASYTVYLVHFPLLAALNCGFARVGWHPVVEYCVAVVAAGALSLLFHRFVVRRSRLLRLLLNGKAAAAAPQWTNRATTSR